MTTDDIVGVTLMFAPDGSPEGVTEVSRGTALACRTAFELALAADDPVLIARLLQELDASDMNSAAVQREMCILLVTSVIRPCLQRLGSDAVPLREMFRHCADEFYSLETS